MDVILAILPPAAVLILMVGFRWGGSKAGPAGWIVSLIIALLFFGAGGKLLTYAHIRAIILTIDVVLIVWAALLLYFIVDQAAALKVISNWFTALTGDDVLRVLLLGWVFASFLQGVGGFGVPVAIVAPLLVGLGLHPLAAVVVPSIGHAWAVTFGSLGSSFITLMGVTDMTAAELAPPAATLLGASALVCGMLAVHAYAGWRGIQRGLPAVLIIGVVMAVVQYIAATSGLHNIGSATGGMVGLIIGFGVTKLPFYQSVKNGDDEQPPSITNEGRPIPSFSIAVSGYVILVVLAFIVKGVEPVKDLLSKVNLAVTIPELTTSEGYVNLTSVVGIKIFAHTGTILFVSALITYWLFKSRGYYKDGAVKTIIQGVHKKGTKTAIGILSMMAMAMVMTYAGMTNEIAQWLSKAVPADLYAFVATSIGGLGAFMTGSNTNSNAVFGSLQKETAILLGLNVTIVLGVQTASAAIASLLAPAKIMVGASTVGMGGNEGVVMRSLVAYGGALLIFIAVMSFIMLL